MSDLDILKKVESELSLPAEPEPEFLVLLPLYSRADTPSASLFKPARPNCASIDSSAFVSEMELWKSKPKCFGLGIEKVPSAEPTEFVINWLPFIGVVSVLYVEFNGVTKELTSNPPKNESSFPA